LPYQKKTDSAPGNGEGANEDGEEKQ